MVVPSTMRIKANTTLPPSKPAEIAAMLLTKKEAARALRLCQRSIENAVSSKALAVIRLGHRCVRFRPEDLAAYIASRRLRAVGE